MILEKYIGEKSIVITTNNIKNKFLEKINSEGKITNLKFYSLEEVIKNYTFEIDEIALYEVVKEFNFKIIYAEKILKYIYNIEDKIYDSNKLKDILKVKKYLEDNNLLHYNRIFKKYFTNKKIYLYGYNNLTSIEEKIINDLKLNNEIIILKEEEKNYNDITIIKCDEIEKEVLFLASKIKELLLKGVNKSNIKINVPNNDYKLYIKKIFNIFNLNCSLNENISIYSFDMTRYFLKLLKETNYEEALTIIRENYDLENDMLLKVYNKLTNYAYLYSLKGDDLALKILKYNLKSATINMSANRNEIHEINIEKDLIKDDDYVFILGLMNTVFPKYKKDDDFLLDIEKQEINIISHNEYNNILNNNLIKKIKSIKNIYLSYSTSQNGKEFTKTSFIDKLSLSTNINEITYMYDYNERNYNKYLLSKNLDDYVRYGEITDELELLYNNIETTYNTYDHRYKKIDKVLLYKYLNNEINLSYSSIDTFFKCPFKFYLENILKIKEVKENTLSLVVGNLVHNVLCIIFRDNRLDYENVIEEVIGSLKIDKKPKNNFYLNKYKKEILKLIEIIKNQNENTEFKGTYYENKFKIDKTKTLKITLKGFIDKVLTFKDDINTYVIVIDYKTGKIETNFNPVIYGINMQLLIYLKLLKENNIGNFAGAYWQNILSDVLPEEEGKTYDTVLRDNYRLDGYTLNTPTLAHIIDKNIENSFIKGLKLKKDGEFYSTSKVLSNDEIDKLLEITSANIDKCIEDIENSSFDIKPLKIGFDEELGCKFCKYKDICFKTDEDINLVKEYKKLEFIKGDDNE